ncbi:hypothetical protein ABOM_005549 [Aspergillus bombycis]|uniref:Zn(2)-C6 fungal-type domain-containing protein n=1 Tax=Aspergillus bombycis TaxID=109264 RepID=A0A1F8A1V6_9EURO|nr:hypothetical protein ABOM_005549 [Aspergillus bombycis]OGM45409.1 hypothetical protein ABOM_005549 [Aspergillus bombycis]
MLHLDRQLVQGCLLRSGARLRTKSGCGECRRRRKKCDEKRPRCGGCTRNDFECRWPPETQTVDRRRYSLASGTTTTTSSAGDEALTGRPGRSLPPPVSMPVPFHKSEHLRIYRYFVHSMSPKLVRQTSLSRYSQDFHIVRLALVHPPLMGALIALAGMKMSSQSSNLQSLALQSYLFAITSLKTGLMEGRHTGTEDWLLATTTLLCLFENSRCDAMPNARSHVLASGQMLSLRRPKPRNASQEAIVFERICVESFLYHAALLTLFDPSVNCLPLIKGDLNLEGYFCDPDHPDDVPPGALTSTQPVLDASYKFFLLVLDITKLAQSFPLTTTAEVETWSRSQEMVVHWEKSIDNQQTSNAENHVGRLYTVAIRILLVHADPRRSMVDWIQLMESYLLRGLEIITALVVDEWFSFYYLWPLLVVGSVAVLPEAKQIVRAKLSQVSDTRQGGPISLAQYRLQKVWRSGARNNDSDHGQLMARQLRTLLMGD